MLKENTGEFQAVEKGELQVRGRVEDETEQEPWVGVYGTDVSKVRKSGEQ